MTDLVIRGGTVVTPDGSRAGRRRDRRRPHRPRSRRSAPAGANEIDARRPARPARPHRRAPAFQRAGAHRMGGRRDRQPRAGGGRRNGVLRHAAQLVAVHRHTADFDLKRAALGGGVDHRFRAVGRAGAGSCRRHGGNGRARASSASRRSCATPACRSFRVPTIGRCSKACAKRRGSDCRWRCTPRARSWCETPRAARSDARDFLASRPVVAELEAIQRALLFAEETGAKLHIVHVSSGRGVALAAEARARGVDVSIETCPHYLFFTEEDVERLGAVAKCAPPLRSADERRRAVGGAAARRGRHRGVRPLTGRAGAEAGRLRVARGAASPACSRRWRSCSQAGGGDRSRPVARTNRRSGGRDAGPTIPHRRQRHSGGRR